MPKTPRIEDSEAQAFIEGGTQSVKWVCEELAETDIAHKRFKRRLVKPL